MMFVPQGDMLGLIDRAYQLVSLASLTDLSVVELPYIDQVCQFPGGHWGNVLRICCTSKSQAADL